MALDSRMAELLDHSGLTAEDLNLNLGPLGPLLPRDGRLARRARHRSAVAAERSS